ncbi:MAG: TonB-dependent receptor, partial [Ferruginibacter sp.]
MHYRRFLTLIFFLFFINREAFAQQAVISGTITEKNSGENLSAVTITVTELPGVGTVSNNYGFYSLSLPAGNYTVYFRHIGHESREEKITLMGDYKLNMELPVLGVTLNEVVITTKKEDANVKSANMGVTRLSPQLVETIPVLFGEKDIIKTLQLTPGVKSAGEGNSGFYVRGGGADQNLILLDEATVYNASHLLGFFSVFNSDVIRDITLYKAGMPAEYGGRASSVLDVKMRDGNNKKLSVQGGLGLISSRLTVEAPIVKEKGSFLISGRRSYADLFLKLSNNDATRNSGLYFYDVNLKGNYRLDEKNKVFLSGYFGRDNFKFSDVFGFDWGNSTGTARWNHLFSNKLFSNTSLIYSNYNYKFTLGAGNEAVGVKSSIQDVSLKQDFSDYINSRNTIKFGAQVTHHTFRPGEIVANDSSSFNNNVLNNKYALEAGLYLQNEQKIQQNLVLQYGLRYSLFNYMGKGKAYFYDADGNKTGEKLYAAGESIKFYGGLEP